MVAGNHAARSLPGWVLRIHRTSPKGCVPALIHWNGRRGPWTRPHGKHSGRRIRKHVGAATVSLVCNASAKPPATKLAMFGEMPRQISLLHPLIWIKAMARCVG